MDKKAWSSQLASFVDVNLLELSGQVWRNALLNLISWQSGFLGDLQGKKQAEKILTDVILKASPKAQIF